MAVGKLYMNGSMNTGIPLIIHLYMTALSGVIPKKKLQMIRINHTLIHVYEYKE